MADGFIQVPVDNVGKRVDATELTRPDGSLVERQRVAITDVIGIDGENLRFILVELRLHSYLLQQIIIALGGIATDELNQMRNDIVVHDTILPATTPTS